MKSPNSCQLMILVVATMLLTGCSLKPRQQPQLRFHNAAAGGSFDCYACGNCGGCIESSGENSAGFDQKNSAAVETSSPVTVEATAKSVRPPYQLSGVDEPVVKTESLGFKRASLNAVAETAEASIINEVQPKETGLHLQKIEAKVEPKRPEGGEFKPPASPKLVEAPKATEVLKKADASRPAEIAKPVTASKPVEVAKPADITSSTFKSGKEFQPRRTAEKSLDSSDGRVPSSDLLLPAIEDTSNEMPQTVADDSLDSFFGRGTTIPQSKPQQQSEANDRIVLRANPVDHNVAFNPPSKSVSCGVVPALKTSFKNDSRGNTLRSFVHTDQPAIEESTAIVKKEAIEIRSQATEIQPLPAVPDAMVQSPSKTIPVRLRAIQMNDQMIKGRQVKFRFKTHEPTQQAINQWHMEKFPANQIHQPFPTPRLKVLQPELNLEIADPDTDYSLHELTARADDSSDTATPPWRIK